MFVQAFVPKSGIETFDIGILIWFSGRDELVIEAVLAPVEKRGRAKLRTGSAVEEGKRRAERELKKEEEAKIEKELSIKSRTISAEFASGNDVLKREINTLYLQRRKTLQGRQQSRRQVHAFKSPVCLEYPIVSPKQKVSGRVRILTRFGSSNRRKRVIGVLIRILFLVCRRRDLNSHGRNVRRLGTKSKLWDA